MNTKAFIEYEKREEELRKSPKYKALWDKLFSIEIDENLEENVKKYYYLHEKEFLEFDEELGSFEDVLEKSYLEVYELFKEVTGTTIEKYGWDYEKDWKTIFDENLGYDEVVYDFYKPDMIYNFKRMVEQWEE